MIDHVRSSIRAMTGYTPGEQPRTDEFIKLNTNENPYPPSPRVVEAIQAALTGDRLRKYPDPTGLAFRKAAGRVLDVDPEAILIGNGSDDILTILTRAFVPEGGLIASPAPSYVLYRTLADIQGARFVTVPFTPEWDLPRPWPVAGAALTYVPNPNSPSGSTIARARLEEFAGELGTPLVIDEAYADFAEDTCLELVRRWAGSSPVIVTRTLSKSYSLAGIRFGFAIAAPEVVHELIKVKDSYNCDVLSQVAATAALEDQEYFHTTRGRVLRTRERMERELASLGFLVCPSQANFVWCRRSDRPVKPIYEQLKRRGVLVRYMDYRELGDGLRISVGTEEEIDRLMETMGSILG